MTHDQASTDFEDYRAQQRQQVPPVVYLPVVDGSDSAFYEVEMRPTKDGRVALLAYTAMDRLSDCCGPHQPWVLYPTDRLEELGQSQPYDVIFLDMPIPEELRRTAEDTVEEEPGGDPGDDAGSGSGDAGRERP